MVPCVAFLDSSLDGRIVHVREYAASHPDATLPQIARHFGITPDTVSNYLKYDSSRSEVSKKENALLLESRVKDYLLCHSEVSKTSLINDLGSSHEKVDACLDSAGVCLMPKRWHNENKVLREYNHGSGIEDIHEKLGMSTRYVSSVLSRFGKHPRLLSRQLLEKKFLESYCRGNHTGFQLAVDLNISNSMANHLKNKFGLPPQARGPQRKNYPVRDDLIKKGESLTHISKIEGVTRAAIYIYLKRRPELKQAWEDAKGK
jgi:predicted transcriptional regulator